MVLKKREDLKTTEEEIELLQKVLEWINPFLTDHSVFDAEEWDKPNNPRWWLEREWYDPRIWSYWIMSDYYRWIIETYNSMIAFETATVANSITGAGINGDFKLPKMVQYVQSSSYMQSLRKGSEKNSDEKKQKLLPDNSKELDEKLASKLQKIAIATE